MSTPSARTLWCVILLLLFGTLTVGAQEQQPTCYAKIELSPTPKYVGDSCLVNLVLYANLPFVEYHPKSSAKRDIKGGTFRHTGDGTVTDQQQVRDNGQTRFAFIARQYVLEEDPYDFFAPSRLRLVRRHRLKIKSPQQALEISERPKRTTREVMRSGQQVI